MGPSNREVLEGGVPAADWGTAEGQKLAAAWQADGGDPTLMGERS